MVVLFIGLLVLKSFDIFGIIYFSFHFNLMKDEYDNTNALKVTLDRRKTVCLNCKSCFESWLGISELKVYNGSYDFKIIVKRRLFPGQFKAMIKR